MKKHVSSIGILGLGFMGASLAMALRRKGQNVLGWDRSSRHARLALRKGAVSSLVKDPGELAACDTLVLAVPPSAMAPLLRRVGPALGSKTLILDLASVRRGLRQESMNFLGARASCWVGSHPMAGSERSGPAFARPSLFQGVLVILIPPSGPGPDVLRRARAFWTKLGARPAVLGEKEHDRIMALVSHGPHVAAAALMLALGPLKNAAWAGPGFRDLTRVASGDPDLWTDILRRNAPQTTTVIRKLIAELKKIEKALKHSEDRGLKQLLVRAASRRRCLE